MVMESAAPIIRILHDLDNNFSVCRFPFYAPVEEGQGYLAEPKNSGAIVPGWATSTARCLGHSLTHGLF